MRVVTTFHGPSVILSSLKCKLSDRDEEFLVTAGPNLLDISSIRPSGLNHLCSLEVWGTIVSLRAIPIPDNEHSRCNLLVLLGHPEPELIFLSYDDSNTSPSLSVLKKLSLHERSHLISEFLTDVIVHPSGELAVAHCYKGKLRAITLNDGNYEADVDISIGLQNLLAMSFLPGESNSIALLRIDQHEHIQLSALDLNIDDLEAQPSPLLYTTVVSTKMDPANPATAPHLIPIPPISSSTSDPSSMDVDEDEEDRLEFRGGVLVAGGTKLLLYELNNEDTQTRLASKQEKLDSQKKSSDPEAARKAVQKEKERATRKRKPRFSVEWPWSPISAWSGLEVDPLTYFLGDTFGRLATLSLRQLSQHGLILIPLGEISHPSSLTHLGNNAFYVGSRFGDSALIRITPSPHLAAHGRAETLPIPSGFPTAFSPDSSATLDAKGKHKGEIEEPPTDRTKGCILRTNGSYVTVLETFKNIGPIYDAVLVDTDGSGVNQVVTCSGGYNTGSLNFVRTGADYQELGYLSGVDFVTGIFPLRVSESARFDDLLLLSTTTGTFPLKIKNVQTFERIVTPSLETSSPTLAAGNITWASKTNDTQFFVQVTSKKVALFEVDSLLEEYRQCQTWVAPSQHQVSSEIVVAHVSGEEVLVALSDKRLIALTVGKDAKFVQSNKFMDASPTRDKLKPEISALAVSRESGAYAVAYWESKVIEVYRSTGPSKVELAATSPVLSSVVRSLVVLQFIGDDDEISPPYLVAGLADGGVVHFCWQDDTLKDMKVVSLGNTPVSLTSCLVEGRKTVFASGSRALILSYGKGRVKTSPIMLKDTLAATAIDSEHYPSSLILATPHALSIGSVRHIDRLHIRSVPLGSRNPRRIAHSTDLKAFAVLCREEEAVRVGEVGTVRSSLLIMDNTTYREIAQYTTPDSEELVSLAFLEVKGFGTLICTGSYIYREDEIDPSQGKIRLFAVSNIHSLSEAQVSLATSIDVDGVVWSLNAVGGNLVATIAGAVVMFNVTHTPEGTISIKKAFTWNHNNILQHMATFNDTVVVGDVISSLSVLKVKEDSKLETVTRSYAPLWPIAIGLADENNVVVCNDGWNFVTFQLNKGVSPIQLEYKGSYYLGDCVTAILRGGIGSSDSLEHTGLRSSQVFAAASGRIGIIAECEPTRYDLLYTLQRNLAGKIQGVGGSNHTRYRAPSEKKGKTDAEASAAGFLDGDFIQQGLERVLESPEEIQALLEGQNEAEKIDVDVEELRGVLESLSVLAVC